MKAFHSALRATLAVSAVGGSRMLETGGAGHGSMGSGELRCPRCPREATAQGSEGCPFLGCLRPRAGRWSWISMVGNPFSMGSLPGATGSAHQGPGVRQSRPRPRSLSGAEAEKAPCQPARLPLSYRLSSPPPAASPPGSRDEPPHRRHRTPRYLALAIAPRSAGLAPHCHRNRAGHAGRCSSADGGTEAASQRGRAPPRLLSLFLPGADGGCPGGGGGDGGGWWVLRRE